MFTYVTEKTKTLFHRYEFASLGIAVLAFITALKHQHGWTPGNLFSKYLHVRYHNNNSDICSPIMLREAVGSANAGIWDDRNGDVHRPIDCYRWWEGPDGKLYTGAIYRYAVCLRDYAEKRYKEITPALLEAVLVVGEKPTLFIAGSNPKMFMKGVEQASYYLKMKDEVIQQRDGWISAPEFEEVDPQTRDLGTMTSWNDARNTASELCAAEGLSHVCIMTLDECRKRKEQYRSVFYGQSDIEDVFREAIEAHGQEALRLNLFYGRKRFCMYDTEPEWVLSIIVLKNDELIPEGVTV